MPSVVIKLNLPEYKERGLYIGLPDLLKDIFEGLRRVSYSSEWVTPYFYEDGRIRGTMEVFADELDDVLGPSEVKLKKST